MRDLGLRCLSTEMLDNSPDVVLEADLSGEQVQIDHLVALDLDEEVR